MEARRRYAANLTVPTLPEPLPFSFITVTDRAGVVRTLPVPCGGAPRRSETLATRLEEIRAELQVLDEEENPSDEDITRAETLSDEWGITRAEFDRAVEREKRIEVIRSANLDLSHLQSASQWGNGGGTSLRGDDAGNEGAGTRNGGTRRSNKRDPYADLNAVRAMQLTPRDVISRAEDAIEQAPDYMTDAHREAVTRLVHRSGTKQGALIARHVLLTGSEDYHSAFLDYMAEPTNIQRAAMSLTSANGGYLVPFTLDPTVILTNAGSMNPFRQISSNKRTATNTWNGVTSSGMNAAWLAEAGVVGDNTPTFANVVITPQKASAWIFGSYEVLEDSDVATEIPNMLNDAKDRLEEAAFCVGTGTGQPKGIVTAATTTVATAGVATYAVGDVYAVQAALPPRFRRNAKWLMSLPYINRSRQFDTAGGSSYWTNLGQGQPEQLLGGDLYESTSMATVLTTGTKAAVYGDFSQYAIVDRIGMSVLYEPLIKDPTTGRPTGQGGWFAFWRVGADALVPGAFRTLVTA